MQKLGRPLSYLTLLLALAACNSPMLASPKALSKIDPETTPARDIRIMAEVPPIIIPDPGKPLVMNVKVGTITQQYRMVIKRKEQKALRQSTGKRLFVYGLSDMDAAALERLRKNADKTMSGYLNIDGGACSLAPIKARKLKGTVWIKTAELDAYQPVYTNFLSKGLVPIRPCPTGALESFPTE